MPDQENVIFEMYLVGRASDPKTVCSGWKYMAGEFSGKRIVSSGKSLVIKVMLRELSGLQNVC